MNRDPEKNPITARDTGRDLLVLAGFCAFLFFWGLSYFGLIGADEPRYAQVAREMLARHDWITPYLGGKPWLEKPVLYYWQAMLSYRIFGVSDWAARLPSAVDATLMVLAVYLFLRRFRPGIQLDGALMTASAAGVIGFARAASMDMPMAAAFTIGMLAWYAWHESGRRTYLGWFYFFIALATLAKGPVAPLLAAMIIVIFAAAKADYGLIWRTLWIPAVLIFCVVALPWYVAVQVRNPQFFREFILQHNLERFGTNLYHHQQPFWYFLPVLALALVPWTVFVIAAFSETVRAWWAERREMVAGEDALNAFLVIWLTVPVVFFSFSQSKLPGYILPALPAGTLLVTEYVRRHVAEREPANVAWRVLHAIVASAPIIPALMLQYILLQHRLPWEAGTRISIALAAVLAVAMFFSLRGQQGLRMLRFITLVPVVLALAAILRMGAPALSSQFSARWITWQISRVETQRLPVAVFRVSRETEYGLAFYRNQVISRYESGQIPSGEHLVVAPSGSQVDVAKLVAGRRVSYLGSYAPQGLDYFWVGP
jgi:4-amino-4-deoxy-L-arabinose transferase-like glycosyltransferase